MRRFGSTQGLGKGQRGIVQQRGQRGFRLRQQQPLGGSHGLRRGGGVAGDGRLHGGIHVAIHHLIYQPIALRDGGAKGMVQGEEVRIGTLAYMHLSGVKIPDKIKEENALYTAVSGELAAVFPLRYRPMASVQRALAALRREHRKPIFAVRDFNLDPLLLQKTFGVSAEGFQFPSSAERYRISGIPASAGSPAAGVMAQDGLDTLDQRLVEASGSRAP